MASEIVSGLRAALEQSPNNEPLRILLGEALLKEGEWREAEPEFLAVLARNPRSLAASRGLAKAYFHQEKYTAAIVVLEDIREQNDVELLVLQAKCYFRNGEVSKAIELYKKVLERNSAFKDEELDSLRNTSSASASTPGSDEDTKENDALQPMERPNVNFADVGGMESAKEAINIKIVQPLLHPELYKKFGKSAGGGILLYGPPGCGKTYLARATAGEIKASFISIGIHDVLDMWMGNSEKRLHELFELARRQSPCLIFFDEIDALGASRTDMRQSAGRMLINQLLTEMDGISASNEGLLIIGATNAPWHLDPAFRRPGRFDRIIFVQPPDEHSREEIFKILLKEKPVGKLDLPKLARATSEFSGADIQAVINVAIEEKLRLSFKSGKVENIQQEDLTKAIKSVRPSTKEWFNSARNYALYANESGLYDDILSYLKIKK